jgi:hypothetical protein
VTSEEIKNMVLESGRKVTCVIMWQRIQLNCLPVFCER